MMVCSEDQAGSFLLVAYNGIRDPSLGPQGQKTEAIGQELEGSYLARRNSSRAATIRSPVANKSRPTRSVPGDAQPAMRR